MHIKNTSPQETLVLKFKIPHKFISNLINIIIQGI